MTSVLPANSRSLVPFSTAVKIYLRIPAGSLWTSTSTEIVLKMFNPLDLAFGGGRLRSCLGHEINIA